MIFLTRKMCAYLLLTSIFVLPASAQRRRACCTSPAPGANQIDYHGGPILTGTVNVYFIWYGTWNGTSPHSISDSPSTQFLLTNLIRGLNGSSYEQTNATYNGQGFYVTGLLNMGGSVTDSSYWKGTNLAELDVRDLVVNQINKGSLPADTNGIYLVLTSSDIGGSVTDPNVPLDNPDRTHFFCTSMCGWHASTNYLQLGLPDYKIGFVGNPDRCPNACEAAANRIVSPNNNTGGDGMANHVTHEISESLTDPDGDAWYDSSQMENADKCFFNFGVTSVLPNGSQTNVNFLGINYLIQKNWVNALGGFCSMTW